MINIAKLLKDAPKGMKLYSPLFGEVGFKYVEVGNIIVKDKYGFNRIFSKDGKYFMDYDSECLLFPSKDCRTWEGWKLPAQPKFKVGDWIVRGEGFVYEPSLITEIRDYYICENQNGERATYTLNDVHKNFHLWAIQDAKDGDVLVTIKIRNCPFIYHKPCYDDGCAYYYVGLDGRGNLSIGCFRKTPELYLGLIEDAIPATKEQRDLLFKKIKEAGYQWDADKKELRKTIEPKFKVGDEIKTGNTIETIAEVGHATRSYYCESGRTISFENQDLWHLAPKPHYDIANFKPFDHCRFKPTETHDWIYAYFWYIQAHYKVEHLFAIEKWES